MKCSGEKAWSDTKRKEILGPYALLLEVLLFYWPEVVPGVATSTYRGMHLNKTDIEMYKVGMKFVWLSFISSSTTKGSRV